MDSVCLEIGLNSQHVVETNQSLRYQIICDKQWLHILEKKRKIAIFPSNPKLDKRAHPEGNLDHPWCRILLQLYKKKPNVKVYSLKSSILENDDAEFPNSTPLSYSQAVYNVASTNFKNLWETFCKNCPEAYINSEKDSKQHKKCIRSPTENILPYDVVLKELISKLFKCPVIHCKLDRLKNDSLDMTSDEAQDCHTNIMHALIAIETSSYFAVFFYPPCISTSLYDCITFSPAILTNKFNKSLFLIYQLLQLYKYIHSQGLTSGDIYLKDILLNENLWISLVPDLEANIVSFFQDDAISQSPSDVACHQDLECDHINEESENLSVSNLKLNLKFSYDYKQLSLRDYCEMWCNGLLSNYDYLTLLNNAAGRSLTNPSYHHIMPWVTDFSSRNGANWRDLCKSKYRLNKGDNHLDHMFQHAAQQSIKEFESTFSYNSPQVPHHVSDFLSEITYFVYMARRTPQHILREHVRPIWVPAEYPSSIQRLQEWTPDECIPEFYSDPMIFKTIHEDLPDLEIPSWASCPEDFICKHREALESQYVGDRLHNWIDLNFGCKLIGKAAIKSKNICLTMVDQHTNIYQRGIVQLFVHAHPAKRATSTWFNKIAPRLQNLFPVKSKKSEKTFKCKQQHLNKEAKRLAKSTETLNKHLDSTDMIETKHPNSSKTSPRLSLKIPSTQEETISNFYNNTNFIELPKDYSPFALLQSLETSQQFIAKTFPLQKPTENAQEKIYSSDLLFENYSENHSFTNQLFNDVSSPSAAASKHKTKLLTAAKFLSTTHKARSSLHSIERRQRDLQILGCLIVEIFALPKLRPLIGHNLTPKFEERLKACLITFSLHKSEIPKCLRSLTLELLNLNHQDIITENGLPLPSTEQLLEPIYQNLLIPFPINYYPTYVLIKSLQSFDFASILLELHTHFHCNGMDCSKYVEIDRLHVLYERKIAKCKVMSCCAHIRRLLDPVGYEQFSSIDLLLPHIIDLLTQEHTSILAAWNLFDVVAQSLGVAQTQNLLLHPIMKLYDVESFERGMTSVRNRSPLASISGTSGLLRFSTSSSFKSRKSVKLYHQIFLLRLMVRFGLKCFLSNFIAPLIEAVGGYKEPEESNGLHYHSNLADRRCSKNLNYAPGDKGDEEESEISAQKGEDLEENIFRVDLDTFNTKPDVEAIFCFEDDAILDRVSTFDEISNRSLDSFDIKTATAEEAKEDEERQLDNTSAKLAISEIIYGSKISNNSFEEPEKIFLSSQNVNSDFLISNDQLGPRSPTIAIPANVYRRSYQLNTIDCDIGSRKSVDSFEVLQNAAEEEQKLKKIEGRSEGPETEVIHCEENTIEFSQDACDSLQASVISKMSEEKSLQNSCISEMSSKSLVWLAHRLGPVLTSRFISKNLLKMLSLCYVSQENLLPETGPLDDANCLNYFTVSDARVVGDRSAARVLECLMSIAALYGEEVILLQYFPHISELVAMSTKRITGSLEGALVSTLQLLKYLIPCLTDATIMEHLKDSILDLIILPVLRFLASSNILMPSGYLGRSVLSRKLLDAVYVLSVRIGSDMTREHLCNTVLRPFFLIFDKAYGEIIKFETDFNTYSISPPAKEQQLQNKRDLEEIRDVFSPALAYSAYLTFLRFLGEDTMKQTVLNLELILTLCHNFESPDYKAFPKVPCTSSDAVDCPTNISLAAGQEHQAANSFGTQVVGNRIEVVSPVAQPLTKIKSKCAPNISLDTTEVLDVVAYKFDNLPKTRYLKGNWLAYWRHEITRSDKDTSLNLKQIKLQSFMGHTNSVRAILSLDNENSFISASKDKTVKLWSLRSEGDGTKATSCQFTYTAHKKSIHSLAFLHSMRFVVSCDSGVHIWDPFIGRPLAMLDSAKHNPITVVKCLPSPSPLVLAGTAEASVKIIDSRSMQYVNEWRVSTNTQSNATVRCLTVAPSGNWMAVGLSSGTIAMLDARTGIVLNSWRPMECDLLQLIAPNDQQLISSALDHSLAVWHAHDGILHYQLMPPAEPAHFLQTIGSQLVYATTGNRIGIYSDINSSHASHNLTKLRSENFKGVLTSLAVLPLNHAFLVGNECGNISLLC